MNAKFKIALAALAIAILFPLSNFMMKHDSVTEFIGQSNSGSISIEKAQLINKAFQKKCIDCHSSETKLPFYANLPVAKQIIEKDIKAGIRRFDLSKDLQNPSELILARLEATALNGSMPPGRYKLMHWDAGLTEEEQEAMVEWVQDMRLRKTGSKEAIRPLPQVVKVNWSKVELGDRLYHDKRLSGDNSLSCASCHSLSKGGTDQVAVSTGIGGQKGDINSPTVFNSSYNVRQFWDGRAKDLEEQAHGPVHNPAEMGSNWDQVITKLKKDKSYTRSFNKVYSGRMNGNNIANAIAEFEKSLVTPNSRFDIYLRGNKQALNAQEIHGYKLFKEKGCISCHFGEALGGTIFEKMGYEKKYFGGKVHKADKGRFNFTNNEEDMHKFKVPILRNVALTYPYLHDAKAKTLKDAVKLMAKHQLGKPVSDSEAEDIVKFLETLTGEYKGKNLGQ